MITAEGPHQAQTHTDGDGRFSLPMVRHYGFQPLLSEGLSECEGTLRIEAAGYRPFGIDCIGLEWNRTRRRLDFGSIKYERRGDSFYQVRVILAPDI